MTFQRQRAGCECCRFYLCGIFIRHICRYDGKEIIDVKKPCTKFMRL